MKRLTDRRTILLATATAAAMAGGVAAQSPEIMGTVTYETGGAIPAGVIRISLDGEAPSAGSDAARDAMPSRLDSSGKSTSVEFAIPQPASAARSAIPVEIVATLEREDGWLLARGSAPLTPGELVTITMFAVMY